MKQTKLAVLWQSFSAKEQRLLFHFMHSPFHVKDATVIRLFDLLQSTADWDKKKLFGRLFPGKRYDDLKMRHLSNLLYTCCLEFLGQLRLRKSGAGQAMELLEEFRERGLEGPYRSIWNKSENQLSESARHDTETYYRLFRLHSEYNLFIEGQHKREQEPNLQKISDMLDIYYLIHKLKVYCKALSYGNIVNVHYEIDLVREILSFLENGKYRDIPLLALYQSATRMLEKPEDETCFDGFKLHIDRYVEQLATEERKDLLVLAKNYCIRKLNQGRSRFIRELFDLYKLEFPSEQVMQGQLSPLTYKNVVAVCLHLKEFSWVERFMEDYRELLPEMHREATYCYNKARYHFVRREFSKVVGLLTRVEPGDLFLNIDVKILLLKTYYERNNWQSLESLIQSLRSFIRRKTILSYHRKNYLNFLLFLERMIKSDRRSVHYTQIRQDITAEAQLTEREWLLEKLAADQP